MRHRLRASTPHTPAPRFRQHSTPPRTVHTMLDLTIDGLSDPGWADTGIKLPQFDVKEMVKKTKAAARWMHFAPSNLFTGEIAPRAQQLLDMGLMETGIVGVETWDEEIVSKVMKPHDNLRVRVVMPPDEADRSIDILASLADTLAAADDWEAVLAYFAQPSLQMVTVTCTEKGYGIDNPGAEADAEAGPEQPSHIMAIAAAGAWHRFQNGAAPLAFVSMDNCAENGKLFQGAVMSIAERWAAAGKVSQEFMAYMNDTSKITFPWTMIDRITPRPDDGTVAMLNGLGVGGMDVVQTTKGTFIAPFSNTEHISYLAVQDAFPNGRPPLEETGVLFAPDTEGVAAYEAMKVGTCLNPLHTTLAVFGCLLGHTSISEEMADAELSGFLRAQSAEALPKAVRPAGIEPEDFLRICLTERFPNPNVPDTPQRIATDTSQKMDVRYGGTMQAYGDGASSLTFIPLAVAGWLRYLAGAATVADGIGDDGHAMELSDDGPFFDTPSAVAAAASLTVGSPEAVTTEAVKTLLDFGFKRPGSQIQLDLYEMGVGDKIEGLLREFLAGPGAVRTTLRKYLAENGSPKL